MRAKTVTTNTTLTINDGIISSDQFSSASVGDVITFSHETSGGTHFKLFYKIGDSDSWAYHKFTGVTYNSDGASDYYTPWINYENTYTINVNSDDLTNMKKYGIWLEDYASVTGVTLTHRETEDASGTTAIWSGSHPLGSWSSLQLTNSDYIINKLANAKIGDVIQVTYTTASDGSILLQNSNITGDLLSTNVSTTSVATTVEYEIASATVLEAIQSAGVGINGQNAIISAVDLLTYFSSYDAVAITVGTEGIATYSNGSKNVQISTCDDLKAYYASAVSEGTVTLTELTCIPASQGVIVKGPEGTYTVKVGGDGWEDLTSKNYLKASNGGETVAASVDGKYHYIFAKKKESSDTPGFYKLTAAHELAAHKAYLETPTDITPAGARVALVFSDEAETTGISASLGEKVEKTSEHIYNLRGMRVTQPQKGLYIKNGKKMIIR